MKETKIKILATNETFPVSAFSFWANGEIVHHEGEGYEGAPFYTTTFYKKGEWELVMEEIEVNPISYTRHLEIEELEKLYRKRLSCEFVYDGFYSNKDFDVRGFVDKFHKIKLNIKDEEIENTEGFKFYRSIKEKYREQIREYGYAVNDFELEPYGFVTNDVIDRLMFLKDSSEKRKAFGIQLRKELGLI